MSLSNDPNEPRCCSCCPVPASAAKCPRLRMGFTIYCSVFLVLGIISAGTGHSA